MEYVWLDEQIPESREKQITQLRSVSQPSFATVQLNLEFGEVFKIYQSNS